MTSRTLPCFSAAIAVIAAAGALTGCGAAGVTTRTATSALEQRVITVDSVPVAEEAGLYVAQAQGFFRQQGLNVKIVSITGAERAIPDLQSGRAQLVAGNYVSFILAQMAGEFDNNPVNLRIIADGAEIEPGTEDLYVMPHSRFQTVAELARAHATVGVNTGNNIGDLMVGATLAQAGYRLSDIREVIPAGGFPALVGMLPTGKVDAAWLPQPLGEMAEQEVGAVPLTDFDQGSLQSFPFTGYIGTTQWVTGHSDTVAAFLRALDEGQQLADTDRAAAEQAMEEYVQGVTPIIAATMALDSYPLTMDVPQLQRVADSMYEFGLISRPYQISSMIQPEPGLIK